MLVDIARNPTGVENAKLLYGLGAGEQLSPEMFPMRMSEQINPSTGIMAGGASGAANAAGGSSPSILSQFGTSLNIASSKAPAIVAAIKGTLPPTPQQQDQHAPGAKTDYTPYIVAGGAILALGALFFAFKKK